MENEKFLDTINQKDREYFISFYNSFGNNFWNLFSNYKLDLLNLQDQFNI
jgi:hypothetical protein